MNVSPRYQRISGEGFASNMHSIISSISSDTGSSSCLIVGFFGNRGGLPAGILKNIKHFRCLFFGSLKKIAKAEKYLLWRPASRIIKVQVDCSHTFAVFVGSNGSIFTTVCRHYTFDFQFGYEVQFLIGFQPHMETRSLNDLFGSMKPGKYKISLEIKILESNFNNSPFNVWFWVSNASTFE